MGIAGSVQFPIVPCSSLYLFSRSIGPFQCLVNVNYRFLICCTCHFQSGSLFFVYFGSSFCKSLQCLISALTQGGKVGHLFRLSCSVVLWGGRNTAEKYHWRVWRVLTVSRPHWVCPHSQSVCFPSLHCSGCSAGNCLMRALVCMHFPGLSHSGSGSQVLHKGTDLVGPAFCTRSRSEQLRWPGPWRT